MAFGGSYLDRFPSSVMSLSKKKSTPKKNLFHDMTEDEQGKEDMKMMKVYLRIKPKTETNEENIVEILDSTTLLTRTPSGLSALKKKIGKQEECRYMFSHIFGPEDNQQQVFENCIEGPVRDFLAGYNSLIFSYGTSSAGKTYTVQGSKNYPGIIPRALKFVFNTIKDNQSETLKYMPSGNTIVRMTTAASRGIDKLKQTILRSMDDGSTCDDKSTLSLQTLPEIEFAYQGMEEILSKEMKDMSFPICNKTFSLWISFAEIYNEAVYDLLQPLPLSKQRKQLRVMEDKSKRGYIKDLSYLNVSSGEEAFKFMMFGKKNLQIASTGMNKHSSRSHCIFTITLVQVPDGITDTEDNSVIISKFSICDLAGAERQKKTLNEGNRLKESQYINCSLHILSRCFDRIRDNQNKNEKLVIPYRESKLTRLFQKPLSGEESVIMLVNINPTVSLFEETQQVLKTSAIARKIIAPSRPKMHKRKRSRSMLFSRSLASHNHQTVSKSEMFSKNFALFDTIDEGVTCTTFGFPPKEESTNSSSSQRVVESLLTTTELQKQKIKELQSSLQEEKDLNYNMERDLRVRVAEDYRKLISSIEDKYKARLAAEEVKIRELRDWNEQIMEEMNRKKNFWKKRKRDSDHCAGESLSAIHNSQILDDEIKFCEEELNIYKTENETLKSSLVYYKEENNKLVEKNTVLKFELVSVKGEMESLKKITMSSENDDLTTMLREMEEFKQIKSEELKEKENLMKEAFEEINSLEKENEELSAKTDQLEEKYLLKEAELEELENKLLLADGVLLKKTENIEELEEQCEGHARKITELEKNVESLLDYVELRDEELVENQEVRNRLENDIEGYKNTIEKIEKERDLCMENLANLIVKINSFNESSIASFQQISSSIDKFNDKTVVLENDFGKIKKLAEINKTLQSRLSSEKCNYLDGKCEVIEKSLDSKVFDDVEKICAENQELKNLRIEDCEECKILRKEVVQLNEQVNSEQVKRVEMTAEIMELKNGLEDKCKECITLLNETESLREQANCERLKIVQMNEEVKEMKNRLEDKCKECITLLNETKSLREQANCERLKIVQMNEEVKELKDKLEDKCKERETLLDNIKSLCEDVNDASSKIENISSQNTELNDKVKSLCEEINGASSKIEQISAENRDLKNGMEEKCKEYDNLSNELKLLKEQVNGDQTKIEELTVAKKELQDKVQTIMLKPCSTCIDHDHCQNEKDALRRQIELCERDLKCELKNHAQLSENVVNLKRKVGDFEDSIKHNENMHKTLKDDFEKKREECAALRAKLEMYETNTLDFMNSFKDEREKKLHDVAELRRLNNKLMKEVEIKETVIQNMEKEALNFKENESTILSRYEEKLREANNRVEMEKREVLRMRDIYMKTAQASTSMITPKKINTCLHGDENSPDESDSDSSYKSTCSKKQQNRPKRKTRKEKEVVPHNQILASKDINNELTMTAKRRGKRNLRELNKQDENIQVAMADDPTAKDESPASQMSHITRSTRAEKTLRSKKHY